MLLFLLTYFPPLCYFYSEETFHLRITGHFHLISCKRTFIFNRISHIYKNTGHFSIFLEERFLVLGAFSNLDENTGHFQPDPFLVIRGKRLMKITMLKPFFHLISWKKYN